MKPALVAFSLFMMVIGSVFQSCCKAVCQDDEIFAVDFQGFTAVEMEKIKVLRFNQDNLTMPIDSYYVSTQNIIINTTTRVYLDTPLQSNFNYRINVENANIGYAVTDFQTEKEKCSCNPGTYEKIVGYNLNGVVVSAQNKIALEIKK